MRSLKKFDRTVV